MRFSVSELNDRTTVKIPRKLNRKVKTYCAKKGISIYQFVRETLIAKLSS